jgi:hypothetical protein
MNDLAAEKKIRSRNLFGKDAAISQRAFFKRPHTHDLGVEDVSRLRKFLKEAGPGAHVEEPTQPSRMIVVIDHHAAHVYQDSVGVVRQTNTRCDPTILSISIII